MSIFTGAVIYGGHFNISISSIYQWMLSIVPKISEISVGIQKEKSVSVSSDWNIRDHLRRWSTYFGWNIPTEIGRSNFDVIYQTRETVFHPISKHRGES